MTSKNKIEFAPMPGNGKHKAPWDRTVRSPYEDLIFKDDLTARKLILKTGQNWVRVVPALMGSNNWMTHVSAVAMHHGRFPHPRTFHKEGQSVFERTYEWLAANAPEQLYNRGNPNGHRLLCDNLCAFWCLVENKGGGVDARLFVGSSNKGSATRVAGLGYRIWEKLTEPDEDVDAILEPLDPDHGTMICIEKSQPAGAKFATYHLRVGRQAGPIQNLFDRMVPSEFEVLCPIEQTIRELSNDEQHEHLVRVVGTATAAAIRSSDT